MTVLPYMLCSCSNFWICVDLYSLLSEAQTSGTNWSIWFSNVLEEIVVDGFCIRLNVVWELFLSANLQSCPGTGGLQSRGWVGVRARGNQENYHWLRLSSGTFHCFNLMHPSDFPQTKHKAQSKKKTFLQAIFSTTTLIPFSNTKCFFPVYISWTLILRI